MTAAASDRRLPASPRADSRSTVLRVATPVAARRAALPVPAGGVVLPAGTGTPAGPVEYGEDSAGPAAPRTLDGIVYGLPVPQGSKSATVRRGRAVLFEDNKATHRWRRLVVRTVTAQIAAGGLVVPVFFGPVTIAVTFTFPRPRSAPRRVVWPATRSSGDLDKLLRALFDALTTAGVWEDDARVVAVTARKVYVGQPPYALDAPGVQFCIGSAS